VTLAVNVPGPVATARLRDLGATVTKIEPPAGDPLAGFSPTWYAELVQGVTVVALDLKSAVDRDALEQHLADADVLLTAQRPAALARLGLAPEAVLARHRRLVWVTIVGHASPGEELAGHDLSYLAGVGLLTPPAMPRTLAADLLGAERAVSAALALLHGRDRGGDRLAQVALADGASALAAPLRHGLTAPGGVLAGAFPGYAIHAARDGWVAVAALEPRFRERLQAALGLASLDPAGIADAIAREDVAHWAALGLARDIPIVAVLDPVVPEVRPASEASGPARR
jgi:crotonobetainyl-CoA:carnitine CoA-transferase CaiB-like acyl-CoA transferase